MTRTDQPARPDGLSRRVYGMTAAFLVALALCIFLPAWSLRYWQGMVYCLIFGAWLFFLDAYFLKHDLGLIERRMKVGAAAEREPGQKRIQAFATVFLVVLFVLPGVDVRLHWSPTVPVWLVLTADAIVFLAFLLIFVVFTTNTYAAGIVDVAEGQTVVATGPYAIVRHPMYAGATLLFLATPIALGSNWAVIDGTLLVTTVAMRAVDEERVLRARLPGYAAYLTRVRWRIVPGVW